MTQSIKAYDPGTDGCVRCHARLMVRVYPEPRPGRPQDERITYICSACQFEVRIHRFVNRAYARPRSVSQ
jgi:hypothetical protein